MKNQSWIITTDAKYKSKVEALLARSKSENSEHTPSAEEMERLRALGYVAGVPQKIRWDGGRSKGSCGSGAADCGTYDETDVARRTRKSI